MQHHIWASIAKEARPSEVSSTLVWLSRMKLAQDKVSTNLLELLTDALWEPWIMLKWNSILNNNLLKTALVRRPAQCSLTTRQ